MPLLRFAHVTDLHLNEAYFTDQGADPWQNWSNILKDIRGREIDKVFVTGDIGEASAYEAFFESIKEFDFQVLMGNHDEYVEAKNWMPTNLSFTSPP